jgi:diketogulonate reductase-like aldo/keto reductase
MEAQMKFTKPSDCWTLANGVAIPCVGFGTWQVQEANEAVASVRAALEAGYRHIDTAAAYHNEDRVGQGIRESGIPRSEIFVTSKLHNNMHGYENTLAACKQSLQDLGTGYLDLYMIHWPNPFKYRADWAEANAGTWRAFEELYAAGTVRALGISNFRRHHIERLLPAAKVAPHVNQIRICPGEHPVDVVAYCREKNMLLEAYSPLGTGKIFQVPELKDIAQKVGKSVAQVCLRWCLQHEYLPLTKSVTPSRIKENAEVFGFELDDRDMAAIDSLEGCCDWSRDPDTIDF